MSKMIEVDEFTFDVLCKLEKLKGKSKILLIHDMVKNYVVYDLEEEEAKEIMNLLSDSASE